MGPAAESATVAHNLDGLDGRKATLQILLSELSPERLDEDPDAVQNLAPEALSVAVPCVFDHGKDADELVSGEVGEKFVQSRCSGNMPAVMPLCKVHDEPGLFRSLDHLNNGRLAVVELRTEFVLAVDGGADAVLLDEVMALVQLRHSEIHDALDVGVVAAVLDLEGGNRVLPVEHVVPAIPEGDLAAVDQERVELLDDFCDLAFVQPTLIERINQDVPGVDRHFLCGYVFHNNSLTFLILFCIDSSASFTRTRISDVVRSVLLMASVCLNWLT